MPTFAAPDGTELAFHVVGEGDPLICLPGGPMQDSAYLGDLGGLAAHRRLIMLDPRGTGASAVPADPASYRCDQQVGDVEALRTHLGLERVDLLAHSASANLAVLYAAAHPERVSRLVLVAPSTMVVGIAATGEQRMAIARRRADEPWFEPSFAALEAIVAGNATDDSWTAIDPFFYGRWDEAARAHQAGHAPHRNDEAAAVFASDGAFDPEVTRAALADLDAPVLLVAGEVDLNSPPVVVAEFARLFPNAEFVVQPGAGHFPWVDDAQSFASTVATFVGH